ncbi:FimV family protein [Zoogloea sp.]|uniref:type IV pilus assembly protein FimV n=1 Tax=Zoogloea sp. TaxID=49181 RepID=UPI0035B308DD
MNSAHKPPVTLAATLALLFAPSVMAMGLSDLVVHSALGEPLRAEIRLTRASGEEIDPDCFRIAAPSSGNDDLPWLRDARISLSGERLRITTRGPVNHPAAMLGLRIGCGTEFRRDYPILLQPPIATSTVPTVSPPALEAPARPAISRRLASAPRPSRGASAAGVRSTRQGTTPGRPRGPVAKAGARKGTPGDRLVVSKERTPLRLEYRLARTPVAPETPTPANQPGKLPTISAYDESVAAQLELDEKIKRLEEYQAVLRKRIAELDQQLAAGQAPAPKAPPVTKAAPPQPAPATEAQKDAPINWLGALFGSILAAAGGGLALLLMRRKRPEATPSTAELDSRLPDEPHFRVEPDGVPSHAEEPAPQPAVPPVAVPLTPRPESYAPPPPVPDESADWADPTFAPAHPIPFDETVDEQDSALELAEIMMSFGRTQGAAETLADYIRSNPRQAVKPWIKLLDVYHVAGMRAEFEALTRQLNKTFNVKTITWDDFKATRSAPDSVEQMGHVTQQLQELWGTQEAQVYIHQLLRDNRNGTRQGFPLSVVEELLLLLAVLDDTLGTYRPNTELTLAEMEPRPASKAA